MIFALGLSPPAIPYFSKAYKPPGVTGQHVNNIAEAARHAWTIWARRLSALLYSKRRFKGEEGGKKIMGLAALATPVLRGATHDDLSSGIVGFWQGWPARKAQSAGAPYNLTVIPFEPRTIKDSRITVRRSRTMLLLCSDLISDHTVSCRHIALRGRLTVRTGRRRSYGSNSRADPFDHLAECPPGSGTNIQG